jgi:hypothetical protein
MAKQDLRVDGAKCSRFGVFTVDIDGHPHTREAQYDTYEEVLTHCRPHKRWLVDVGRGKYLTLSEFKAAYGHAS